MPGKIGTKINDRQKLFISEYLRNGFNGSQAAITAGYSKKGAHVQAARMLHNPNISKFIQESKVEQLTNIDNIIQKNLELWNKIAFDENNKTSDRLKASELAGKYAGMFVDRMIHRHEGTVNLSISFEGKTESLGDSEKQDGESKQE